MMNLPVQLYNTLPGKKEIFQPLSNDFVRIYDCGPTVYMAAHIGNMWRYVVSDLVRRTLEYNGYHVRQVMNITDVGHLTGEDLAADTGEDKVEASARRENKTPEEIARFYTELFLKDLQRLNIQTPSVMPRATEHIDEMIQLIQRLEEKGFVYRAGNYILFDIAKFKGYGKLSKRDLGHLRAGARLEPVPGKKSPFDFALWIVDPNHLQNWDSPWGKGYPGWHIECSAMSMKYLGEQLDIHSGGEDNIFPHHENEIAQSEAATGKPFVRYWVHIRHNLSGGRKMSKSTGNFYTLQDLVDRGFSPLAYRYLCLTVHYRSTFNFTWEGLQSAQTALANLDREFQSWGSPTTPLMEYEGRFREAVNDDINLPKALAVVWDLVRSNEDSGARRATLLEWDRVLGLGLGTGGLPARAVDLGTLPPEVRQLVLEREELRRRGDFAGADWRRERVMANGFVIEDTPQGPRVVRDD